MNGSAGTATRVTVIASIVGLIAVMLGGAFNLSNTVNEVNDRLDRNLVKIEAACLALKQLDADLRFHLVAAEQLRHRGSLPSALVDC